MRSGCTGQRVRRVVTRDPDAYANPPLPVIDPAAAFGWLTQE